MIFDTTEWLVQEVYDLLGAGPVGLYEFVRILRSAHRELPENELIPRAEEALDQLLLDEDYTLVWFRWPFEAVQDVPPVRIPRPQDWSGPGEIYLALVERSCSPGF